MGVSDFAYSGNIKRLLFNIMCTELGVFGRCEPPDVMSQGIQLSFDVIRSDFLSRKIRKNGILFIKVYNNYNNYPNNDKSTSMYMNHIYSVIGSMINQNYRYKRLLIKFVSVYCEQWGDKVRNRIVSDLKYKFDVNI